MKERRREKEGFWLSGSKFFFLVINFEFFFLQYILFWPKARAFPTHNSLMAYRTVQFNINKVSGNLKLLRFCHTTGYSSNRGGGGVKTFYLDIHIILVYIFTILLR